MRAVLVGLSVIFALSPHTAAATVQAAPQCTPAAVNGSALQGGVVTVSPLAGSRDASPKTQISFLGVPMSELKHVTVLGSYSGAHAGRLRAYSQGDGASFLPAKPFLEGERVTVRAQVHVAGAVHAVIDTFRVERVDRISVTPSPTHAGGSKEAEHYRSRPDLEAPVVAVTASSPAVAPGDVLLAPYGGPGRAGPMILEPDGALLWFDPLAHDVSAANLSVQQWEGKPVLTWWQGDITVHGYGLGEDLVTDGSYTDIARVRAGNGYQADLHEFQLTPAGAALITAYAPIMCNLASVGGAAAGAVTDAVLQEIDVRTGLVMYEWTSLDHVALGESHEPAAYSSPGRPWDFFHLNSIALASDGGLVISGRNTWAVYDLDASSGRILWRLGGRNSSFSEPGAATTAWQHDARELEGGLISIFDNGASPAVHSHSRGLVLRLERQSATAQVVRELTRTPPLISESEGNVQLLPGGDWFVGWGQEPYFSEFAPDGSLLFEAHMPGYERSYRDLREVWSGTPAHGPVFAFQAGAPGGGTVFASWNGASGVASWRVLAGRSPNALRPVAQASRSGFETPVPLPVRTAGPYLAVQALSSSGAVLRSSATVAKTGLAG